MFGICYELKQFSKDKKTNMYKYLAMIYTTILIMTYICRCQISQIKVILLLSLKWAAFFSKIVSCSFHLSQPTLHFPENVV